MKLKKVLKSKSGIALENAILLMLMTFMFCSLLIGLALVGHYQVRLENVSLLKDTQVDQIGEDFIAYIQNNDPKDFRIEDPNSNYKCQVNGNVLTVWHKNDRAKTVVLYVEVDENGQLERWLYSSPSK